MPKCFFDQDAKNPEPINVEGKVQDSEVGKNTGDESEEFAPPYQGGFEQRGDVDFHPPSDGYANRQQRCACNDRISWNFAQTGWWSHKLHASAKATAGGGVRFLFIP